VKWWQKVVVGALVAIGAIYLAFTASVWFSDCYYQQIKTSTSPDGVWVAVHSQKICKSAAEETQVLLENSADKMEYSVFTAPATSTDVDLTWVSNGELRISYPKSVEPTSFMDTVRDISLTYGIQ